MTKSKFWMKIYDYQQNLDLGWRFTFQQCSDPKNTSKSLTLEQKKKKISDLSWPTMSLDLNSIENLCQES